MKDSSKYTRQLAYIVYILILRHKRHAGNALKSVLFLLVFGMLALGVRNILAVPNSYINEKTGINDIHKYPNSYDVCFFGRSTAICNVSCQELYEQYGIAGVSAAVSNQSFPLTLYTMEEVFQYQSPKVVILDTRALFDSVQVEYLNFQNNAYLHYTLDDIQTFSIKSKALKKAMTVNDNIDPWDYYSKFYYAHENWKRISQKNFTLYDTASFDAMHGNVAYLNVTDGISDTYALSSPYNVATITNKMERYVSDAIDLCEQNGATLMLLTSYVHSAKSQHNAISRLANKYHVKYLDINEFILKSNFNHSLDLYDNVHFNLSGAIKMTDLLGEYLQDNFDFADKRKSSASYPQFEDQKDLFQIQKDCIYAKQSLLSACSFHKYLAALNQLDPAENTIFLSIYGNAFKKLTAKEAELLHELGLQTNWEGKEGGSYAAVIGDDGIQETFSYISKATLTGKIDVSSYEVVSGGSASGGARSNITINGASVITPGNGFNFAVYNKHEKKVIHTCFFDTATSVNPMQRRYKNTSEIKLQVETAPNEWEDAD